MTYYITLTFYLLIGLLINTPVLLHTYAVCPNMSLPHPLCLFSEVASRPSYSGVPSHEFLPQLLYCLESVSCHFRTFKSFLLLTYLITYSAVRASAGTRTECSRLDVCLYYE